MKTLGATLILSLSLAACGGGGSLPNGSVVNSPGGPPPSPPPLVNVKVTVTVPPHTKGHAINPNYISVNTESLVIQLASVNGQGVSGVNPTTINTLARSHDCKSGSGGTVCTATTKGSPGDDVFAVTTYDGTNATGAVLSVGTVQAKISGGGGGVQVSNTLSLTLYGVIAGITLAIAPNQGKRGSATKGAVTLNAYDASGAQIVGPSKFATPMSLAIQGDAQNAFLLHVGGKSGTSFSIVRPTSKIELSYDGNAQASSITLAASVDGPGSNSASAPFTLHGKQPPPPVGTIYALNLGADDGLSASVTEYDGKSSGNAAPKRTLQLSSKLYARSIAVDSNSNLYVGYFDSQFGFSPSDGKPDKGNEIAVYPAGASGNQLPSAIITADKSTNTTIFPLYTAFDPAGNLVTYGATGVDGNGGNDAVIAYAPGSQGPATPAYAWAFVSPLINYAGPTGLALDSAGNFYVNGALYTSLGPKDGLFTALSSDKDNPAISPSRTIPWDATTQLNPGLTTNDAIADSGEIYIGNAVTQGSGSHTSCQGRTNIYSAGPSGGTTDVKPIRMLTLSSINTKNYTCTSQRNPLVPFFPSITLYGTLLFVADDFNNAIGAFKAGGNGTVSPILQITGSATQLNAPIALVITSVSGRTAVRPAPPTSASP
ncbi:MAG TPA: hypothetical protein VEW74_09650 [Candidatus Nitrosotalea sp.]|nr:hypothetical protein [Candidatus Nitrosotalea sp.]